MRTPLATGRHPAAAGKGRVARFMGVEVYGAEIYESKPPENPLERLSHPAPGAPRTARGTWGERSGGFARKSSRNDPYLANKIKYLNL